jgi:hypothetical protein
MAGTKIIAMEGFASYAKIFPENMDDNMEYHAATEGQYNMMFSFATEDDLAAYINAGGPEKSMGHDLIKESTFGIGKCIKLKRPNKHKSGIEDFGGAPAVYDHTEGESVKRYTFTDGELGNGSRVKVKVSIYGEGARAIVRLEKVAVMDVVEFDRESAPEPKEGF